ncbi:MAG: ribonuclease PH [Proteobacteria bacterium SG_bin7]|nr:MAG: ribonuclease PH [Proteobacteria bacterium SG_bin7]
MRRDGRSNSQLRKVNITPNFNAWAEGSVLIEYGNTKVICTATIEEGVPKWMQTGGQGWVTAEYSMLPRATHTRSQRDKIAKGGRTLEISRLIGRSLRAAVDLKALGDRQIIVDCDVIQADGGTRTASISGGFVALGLAIQKLQKAVGLKSNPMKNYIAAVSVGLFDGQPLLDLNYEEDSAIHIDMNFVCNNKNEFVEVQGTAEAGAFNQSQLNEMMEIAQAGCSEIFRLQSGYLKDVLSL